MITETVLNKPCPAKTSPLSKRLAAQPSTAYSGLRRQFVAVVSAQVLLLIGLAAPKAYTLCHGQTITMEASLYDPSDLFRGEYENLTFSGLSTVAVNQDMQSREAVYVRVAKSANGTWTAKEATKHKPALKSGELVLKATTQSTSYPNGSQRQVQVSYGFEKFYVPQGKSANLSVSQGTPLVMQIAVDPSGEACLKQVNFKGHKIFDATNLLHPYSAELL